MIGTAHRAGRLPSRNRGARTAALGRVAVGGAVRWGGDRLDSRGTADERRQRRGRRIVATIDALVDQLAVMRGAAMKAGQVLSTVEFPGLDEDQSAHLQARLASLRDSVPPVGWKQMRKVLASDWGEQPERVLEHIDTEPAAAASIGQVYRGRTHDGREVAIKVQYPGTAESVEADLRNLLLLSPLLRQLIPGLEVKDVLAELRERIVEECDYELAASNRRCVERFWRGHPFVLVPTVNTELSRRRVLVTDWVDGISFDEVTRQPDAVRDRYAQIVYRFFYGTALELGVALGDPHPGNYLLCAEGHVAFFDFGMMRRLPPATYTARPSSPAACARANRPPSSPGSASSDTSPASPASGMASCCSTPCVRSPGGCTPNSRCGTRPRILWRSTEALREQDAPNHILQLRRMTLPPEALLLRRIEGLLFQTAAMMRASAPWGRLLRELIERAAPVGELGAQQAAWLAHHRVSRRLEFAA